MAETDSGLKYSTHTSLGLQEYKNYVRAMQGDQTRNNIISALLCIWLILAGIYNIYRGSMVLGIFMIIVGAAAPLLVRVGANNQSERNFKKIRDAGGTDFTVNFYGDRFETISETSHGVHDYAGLFKVVESDDDFYLEIEQGHSVIVQKKNCSAELTAFLRTLVK